MNEQVWGPGKRVAFRWAFLVGLLFLIPFPLELIPKLGDWITAGVTALWQWGVSWFAQSVLGLPDVPSERNGSGDQLASYVRVLMIALLATAGTILWSVLDRRRKAYPRLAAASWVMLRYCLAEAMLVYGWIKIFKLQFPDLRPGWLHQQLGDSSPMRLLWAFVGYSTPYTVFGGLCEAAAGTLLLWRRTATIGAVFAMTVMTNVVLLNFSYDVPVKLYSMELVVMAGFIALPGARRLLSAALGHAVPEVPARERMSPRTERLRLIGKLALIALIAWHVYNAVDRPAPHLHELYGNWTVDTFAVDGVERTELVTDPPRWQTWTAHSQYMTIWLVDGHRDGADGAEYGWLPCKVDEATHTITITTDEAKKTTESWSYSRPAPDRLVLDGRHRGKQLHVTLHREPDGLLMTRGFHWVNPVPFNR